MKFRPCIDLHEGKVKQIVGKTLNNNAENLVENFISDYDADYFAEIYKKDKLNDGHVIMLGSSNEKQALKALHSYPKGFQIGGGINPQNALYFIKEGASHVIASSYIFENNQLCLRKLEEIVNSVGKSNLVLDLSCKLKDEKYFVMINSWQKLTNFEISLENLSLLSKYCDEFLIHAVDVEGQSKGIEINLVKKLSEWVNLPNVKTPVTYAGSINSLEDIKLLYKLSNGKLDFSVGSSLDIFGGDLPYKKLINLRDLTV
ncbi:MAG: phosphoribosylformimino-5-aminoimidazole carboxamide ribotide isomerase [Nanoarchaeota archaeon]|nr:phosphoribosylformimino-5-aminoimidazole carboxamide ribotide isomerase [Nanoarchaeota archaeon]